MRRRPTTQDVSWFLDLNERDQLNLNPPYQRRSVWSRKDKLFFLDTVFKGYPCPAIFLHKETDDQGKVTFHVVDGKQRLETILSFSKNSLTFPRDHPNLELAGKKFKDLEREQRGEFWDYVITVDMLDVVEQSVVDEVFDRLNRNSKKLDRQELRHAKYDGWFIRFAEDQSELECWFGIGLSTRARARRMKDIQFLSELMMIIIDGAPRGFSQDEIDRYYAEYDAADEQDSELANFVVPEFDERFIEIRDFVVEMNSVNNCVHDHARNYMHFYTLWCFVAKNISDIEVGTVSLKYHEFMSEYSTINRDDHPEADDNVEAHMKYAMNSVGANTDLPQRMARLNALEAALLG
ncbi:DUF262 domain-containing protein [Arenicella xantha]|uniref:Uncharacterized protein DUF262 n=1 Tax=Arenicella xantha TaxID=644221 RepID=A0A395JVB6_9GAMM|nr:DUF262 domain-containing protein [Arenicella xantha]RBP53508.1 uncharacterized protein DUF262 [Arenicella xantha]